jgi:hypothetical protein
MANYVRVAPNGDDECDDTDEGNEQADRGACAACKDAFNANLKARDLPPEDCAGRL